MAIQVRRGNYADLDTSRLVQGEPFITLDETPTGGYYIGMAIAPSNVVRLATHDELVDIRTDCEQFKDDAEAAADAAADSESNAATSEANASDYAEDAETYWHYIDDAINMVVPTVSMNFVTGELEVEGTSWYFGINQTTGQLEWAVSHI